MPNVKYGFLSVSLDKCYLKFDKNQVTIIGILTFSITYFTIDYCVNSKIYSYI
jgi:hypothetical protein